MEKETQSTQSEKSEEPQGLSRPPESAVTTDENILGGTGDDKAEAPEEEAQKTEESAPEDSDKQPKKKRRSSRDRRIRRALRDKAAAESELEQERRLRMELEAELDQARSERKPPQKPKLQDYDTEDEFADALIEWRTRSKEPPKKTRKAPAPRVRDLPQEELVEFLETGSKELGEGFEEARRKASLSRDHQDFWPLSRDMTEYLLESDFGHEMFVALSKDPKLSRQIAQQRSPLAMVEMLQDLEIRMDPDSRPEDREVKEQRRAQRAKEAEVNDSGDKKRRSTKAPPPGPKQERGGPTTRPTSIRELLPKGDELTSKDMEAYMRERRRAHKEGLNNF